MELKVIKSLFSPSFAGRLPQSEALRFSGRWESYLRVALELRNLHGVLLPLTRAEFSNRRKTADLALIDGETHIVEGGNTVITVGQPIDFERARTPSHS